MRINGGVALLCALAATACGSVEDNTGDDAPSGQFVLSVDPGSLSLPINSSGTVTLDIARTGTTGEVMLSVANVPSNLQVEFAPNPVPDGVDTTTLTVVAVGGMPAATASLDIAGTAASGDDTTSLSVTTTTVTVSGIVRGARQGVTVGMPGKANVISGSGGSFSFSDVVPPYDVFTIAPGGNTVGPIPEVTYFAGLSRLDPVVTAAEPITSAPRCLVTQCPESAISGTRSGAGAGSTEPALVVWSNLAGQTANISAANTYSLTARWVTGNQVTGNLHGLQFTRGATGAPTSFIGYGRALNATLTNGSSATVNLVFNAVSSTGTISGTITPGSGDEAPTLQLNQDFDGNGAALWSTQSTTTASATFPILPQAGGANFFASQRIGSGTSSVVTPLSQNADVSFAMLEPAVTISPANSSVGVTAMTPYEWEAPDNVISHLRVTCGSSANFNVFTRAKRAMIPVSAAAPFPTGGQSCNWQVIGYGPSTSMDDAVTATRLEQANASVYVGARRASTTTFVNLITTQSSN